MEIIFDGIPYEARLARDTIITFNDQLLTFNGEVYAVAKKTKELTLDDCVRGNYYFCCTTGEITGSHTVNNVVYTKYPTEAIAYKDLLYGLLCSVALKLNGDWNPDWNSTGAKFKICKDLGEICIRSAHRENDGSVVFKTEQLAKQAIDIFAKSKFNLKKLFE
jgi:hypothetical protein